MTGPLLIDFLPFLSSILHSLSICINMLPPNTMPILSKSSIQYRRTWNIPPETQVAQGSSLMISFISLCFHISCLLFDAICMMIHGSFHCCLHHVFTLHLVIPHIPSPPKVVQQTPPLLPSTPGVKRYEKVEHDRKHVVSPLVTVFFWTLVDMYFEHMCCI